MNQVAIGNPLGESFYRYKYYNLDQREDIIWRYPFVELSELRHFGSICFSRIHSKSVLEFEEYCSTEVCAPCNFEWPTRTMEGITYRESAHGGVATAYVWDTLTARLPPGFRNVLWSIDHDMEYRRLPLETDDWYYGIHAVQLFGHFHFHEVSKDMITQTFSTHLPFVMSAVTWINLVSMFKCVLKYLKAIRAKKDVRTVIDIMYPFTWAVGYEHIICYLVGVCLGIEDWDYPHNEMGVRSFLRRVPRAKLSMNQIEELFLYIFALKPIHKYLRGEKIMISQLNVFINNI